MSKFIPQGYPLRVRRSLAGLGLYTEVAIPKGKCIIEYTGRVVSEKEQEAMNGRYLFEINKKKTIDGSSRLNKARYINHSCRPNCEIEIWKERVYVFSKRTIRAGEELSYDYDTEYFDEFIKPAGCRCIKHRPDLHKKPA
jgi:SET domain-containing protein